MEQNNAQLGHMRTIFQIAASYDDARAYIVSILHDFNIKNYHASIKSTFRYRIDRDLPDAIFSLPKSRDASIENLLITVTGKGVANMAEKKTLQVILKAEAEKLIKKGNLSKLTQGIASEDVRNSQIMCFQLGGLKKGYEVEVVLEQLVDTKILCFPDKSFISAELPTGISLLYTEPRSMQSDNHMLKNFFKILKSVTKFGSFAAEIEKVSLDDKLEISGPLNPKLFTYDNINKQLFKNSVARGVQFKAVNPKYSDWSNFRITLEVPPMADEITTGHVSRCQFSQTNRPIPSSLSLKVMGLLRIRHIAPFQTQVQESMQRYALNRDPNFPEFEQYRKYTSNLAPFDVFFLLDQSRSMNTHNRHNLAIQGLQFSLKSLVPNTSRFNIYTFNGNYKNHFGGLIETNDQNVKSALELLNTFKREKGTVLYQPLLEVLNTPMSKDRKRVIIILSDGELTSHEAETNALIKERFSANPNLMLCGLCVGQKIPVKFYESLKEFTNGGQIEYLNDQEPIPDAYVRLLQCCFWPTYWLKNFKIVGANAAYMHPALPEIEAPQAEAKTVSFFLTGIGEKITVSYQVYLGSKLVDNKTHEMRTLGTQNNETESMMKVEAHKLANILADQEARAMDNGQVDQTLNPFNRPARLGQGRLLPVIDRPTLFTFQQDLERIGLRFGLITPYTSLAVNLLGVDNAHTWSETYDPPAMYGNQTRSYLSNSRNASILADFDKLKFGSKIQQEFEDLLSDEALLGTFEQDGVLKYTPEKAQKLCSLGFLTQDRAIKIASLQSPHLKDYNLTKYVTIVLLKIRGDLRIND